MSILSLNRTAVVFTRLLDSTDGGVFVADTSNEVGMAKSICHHFQKVVFLDIPPTEALLGVIKGLKKQGISVGVRDHHGVSNPTTPREKEIYAAAGEVMSLVTEDSVMTTRFDSPSCVDLVSLGEWARDYETLLVADADMDGVLTAMKAVGIGYEGIDSDGGLLDGPQSGMTVENGVSSLGMLLVKGWSTLPPFNRERPTVRQEALERLVLKFAEATRGEVVALDELKSLAVDYDAQLEAARNLAQSSIELYPGIWVTDTTSVKKRYNNGELSRILESKDGCKVTVTIKQDGPIGKLFGLQYSLAVARQHQKDINLSVLVPEGTVSSPEAGCISNTSFLLHCSKEVWEEILPKLQSLV